MFTIETIRYTMLKEDGLNQGAYVGFMGLATGVLLLALPHLASAQTGFAAAWGGLPFPGELLFVILTGVVAPHLPKKLRAYAPAALIVAASLLVTFEAWCLAQGHAGMNTIAMGLIEEALHGLSVALWVVWLLFERAENNGEINIALYVVSGLSGALWYAGMSELRLGEVMNVASAELMSWGFTLAWSICAVAFLYREAALGVRGSLVVLTVFSGVLFGNRGWWILYPLDVRFLIPGFALAIACVALMLACAAVAWALPAKGSAEDRNSMEEPTSFLEMAGLDTTELSAREREALELALEGATVDQAAERMGIARSTVASYRSRALSKLDVGSVQDLLALIRKRMGIAGPNDGSEEDAHTQPSLWDTRRAAVSALLVIPSVAVRFLVPEAFLNALLTVVFACVFAAGIESLLRVRQRSSVTEIMVALLAGSACAIVCAGCVFGPQIYLVRRLVVSLCIVYLLLFVMRHFPCGEPHAPGQSTPYERVRAIALTCAGLVGCALVPPGSHAIVILSSAGWATGLAAAALLCAALLCVAARERRLADLANASLIGDERKLAYLQGCGLGALEAKVALLTAHGFSRAQIAETLALAPSTVSSYRSFAYAALGVANRQGLTAALSEKTKANGGEAV